MGLKKSVLTGLAFVMIVGGSGYVIYEVKEREIQENQKRYEKTIERLETDILGVKEELESLKAEKALIEANKAKLEDELEIYKEVNEEQRQELIKLKKQLQEPRTVSVSRGGQSKGKQMTVEATAYTPRCKGCSGITATGIDVRQSIVYNGYGIVAVDPKVIPLGSIVVINGKQYLAADTGGAIKGNRIDILHRTKSEALEFGRRNITITVYSKK